MAELERRATMWDDSLRYSWITKGALAAIAAFIGFVASPILKKLGLGP